MDLDAINFCKAEADQRFTDIGLITAPNGGSAATGSAYNGLVGGAFYDRKQNTMYTPANLFWARFNRMRAGGAGVHLSCPCQ